MEYSLADLARITGAKPRSLQLWADAGVIRALSSSDRAGSGTHRQFSRTEAMVASIIAPLAGRKMAIGALIEVADAVRSYARTHKRPGTLMPDFFERAAAGEGLTYLILFWRRKGSRMEIDHFNLISEKDLPDAGLFEIINPKSVVDGEMLAADVIALNAAFRNLGPA